MAVLNLARAHPGLLQALCRYLDKQARPVDAEALYSRFVPGSVDLGPKKGPAISFDNTVEFGRRIGVFRETTAGIDLTDAHRGGWASRSIQQARQVLLDVLLDESNAGRDPFGAGSDETTADFARLAAWLVRVDPTGPLVQYRASSAGHPRTLMDRMGGETDWVPGDAAGWDAFARWAVALGLARERPTTQQADQSLGLMPDVYPVVRSVLGRSRPKRVQTLEALLRTLGEAVPVLTTGRLDQAWRRATSQPDDREVFSSLSFALFRLAQDGLLELLPTGDGVPYALRFGTYVDVPSPFGARSADERRYSNVRILEDAV